MKHNVRSVIGAVLFVLLVCTPAAIANGGTHQNRAEESASHLDGDDGD